MIIMTTTMTTIHMRTIKSITVTATRTIMKVVPTSTITLRGIVDWEGASSKFKDNGDGSDRFVSVRVVS